MAQYLVFDNPTGAPGAFLQKEVILNWDNVKYIEPINPLTFKLQLNNGGNILIDAAVAQSSAVIEKIREVVKAQAGGKILRIKPDFIGQWTINGFAYNPPSSGGGVTGSGVANTVAVWDSASNLTNGALTEYTPAHGNLLQGSNPGTPGTNPKKGTTAFGIGAAQNFTTQSGVGGDAGNTAFGFEALGLEDNGGFNTAIGYKALGNQNVTTGFNEQGNTAVGYQAGIECTLSLADTFVGTNIKSVNTGQSIANVGVGWKALEELSSGFANVALGRTALEKVTTNQGNIAIGYNANDGTTTGDFNIVIGYDAQPSSSTVSNEITLGNSSTAVLRCQQTTITSLSDERDKTSIEDLPYGLDFINKLQPRKFVWDNRSELRDEVNDDGTISKVEYYSANKGKKDFGFIAQEVQTHDDDVLKLVYDENPDKLEMSYGKLVPILVKAIQELKNELDKKQDK